MKRKLATIWQRVVAWIIDIIIVGIISAILGVLAFSSFFLRGMTSNPAMVMFSITAIIVVFLVMFGYTIYFEGTQKGQTLGKRAMGIRVVDEKSGKNITLEQAIIRNILRIIDNQFFGLVAFILIVVTEKRQRIGDIIAKTIVVQD